MGKIRKYLYQNIVESLYADDNNKLEFQILNVMGKSPEKYRVFEKYWTTSIYFKWIEI